MTVTVVVPTANRPTYVRRLLELVHTDWIHPSTVRLVVADGSADEHAESTRRACEKYGARYKRYSPDILVHDRIADALETTVETELCGVFGDDDILCEPGLRDSVAFLNGHADYAIAHGWYAGFREAGMFHTYVSPAHEDDDPLRRVFQFLSDYQSPLFYAIGRTGLQQRTFRTLASMNPPGTPRTSDWYLVQETNDALAIEMIVGLGSLLYGKEKRVQSLYCGRKFESYRGKYVNFSAYIHEPAFPGRLAFLTDTLVALAPPSIDRDKLRKTIHLGLCAQIGANLRDESLTLFGSFEDLAKRVQGLGAE